MVKIDMLQRIMKQFSFCRILVIIFFLIGNVFANADTRRHFIILQDNSGSYYNYSNEDCIKKVQNGIIRLFENKALNNEYNNLWIENNNNVLFFDSEKDEISFFWFVAGQYDNIEFRDYRNGNYNFFVSYFINEGTLTEYRSANTTINNFLSTNFASRPPVNQGSGYINGLATYSFTAFAYPCVLDILKTDYTSEYIIIIISDFKAGSTFGNKQDEKIFKQAFRTKADNVLKRINWLNGQFYKIDYFDYYYDAPKGLLGMTAFKIKPNAGLFSPENVNIRINSDIRFIQKRYLSNHYVLNPTEIIFEHNNKLTVNDITIEISGISGDIIRKTISDFTIDTTTMTYRVPSVDITIEGLNANDQDIGAGTVNYIFKTGYSLANNSPMRYTFEVSRSIDISNFEFLTELSLIQIFIMMTLLILIAVAIVAYVLHILGKPIGILLKWESLTDSYESTDFSKDGRGKILTDYMDWTETDEENGWFQIKVRGKFDYRNRKRFYNWKEQTGFPITITPVSLITPNGFSAQVECDARITNSSQYPVTYDKAFKDGKFEFLITFKKDHGVQVIKPLYFAFKIKIEAVNEGFNNFRLSYSNPLYEFHVGPNLGSVWVGLDPGTTGSCIATATDNSDLVIEKEKGEDKIFLSEITIDPDKITKQSEEEIKNACFFGDEAHSKREMKPNMKHFVSIKKLVGYADKFTIKDNVEIDTVSLSSLLIGDLFKKHKAFINNIKQNKPQFFEKNEEYVPQRLAVAIPNNFTATKIQHLKESIEKIPGNPFREIRFIYEAEAILVHYINQKGADKEKQMSESGETVFVYDMGGATINATLANIKQRKNGKDLIYHITIISKLGYGIGGDTIDYAFIKWIYSKKDNYSQLIQTDPFDSRNADIQQRHKLKEKVLKLKEEAINNYNKGVNLLLRPSIQNFGDLDLKPIVDENGRDDNDPFKKQCLNGYGSFLFDNIFENYIWNNIRDIVNDIVFLCREKGISSLDTVIMSGRSSCFPRVGEIVEEMLKSSFSPKFVRLPISESKSAVAKGACYYGTQKKSIVLKSRTVNGVFGVTQKLAPAEPANFYQLINAGQDFNEGSVSGSFVIKNQKGFGWDGNKVRFCQVMGVHPKQIIANDEKHKYSDIAIFPVKPFPVERVSMEITDKDKIFCTTWDSNGGSKTKESEVKDAEIAKSNDEHYTFFIK